MGDALEKKNFSEYLVDSKSCCTFASATQKKGVPERAWRSDWSEVSDTVSRERCTTGSFEGFFLQ